MNQSKILIPLFLILFALATWQTNSRIQRVYEKDYQMALNAIKGGAPDANYRLVLWELRPYVRDNYKEARYLSAYVYAFGFVDGRYNRERAMEYADCSGVKRCVDGEISLQLAGGFRANQRSANAAEYRFWLADACARGNKQGC